MSFEVEQNTLGGDFGGEASDSDDSSYKDYESGTSYSDSFDSNGDRIDEPEGSIEAISLLFPNGESRNCARHLYNNFKNMEGFKGQESAEAWLRDKDLRTWSRAHFSTRCKSDLLLNNNNECFNKAAEKYPGPLCPRIQNKLSEIVSQSNNIWPIYAGNEKYEVLCNGNM
ncbi:hypothetical protein GOBAR_AA05673 [Gossypium barbadense]|uniref:Uncharacterized protein n=1 Tax=Gossypium barbadense TaxID=3634 RepID=A0A2P5YH41_GOSBA|nr:hypothetical protein GOBAR_AA05673 [Gossypium barbadense]